MTYMQNQKNNTNESTCKTETDSQTQKTILWLPKEGEGQIKSMGLTDRNYYT